MTKTNVFNNHWLSLISTFSRCCKSNSGFNHWLLHFFSNEFESWWTLMNLDEIWWKTRFSSNFIKVHFFFKTLIFLMNFEEIWWKTMFSPNFIKFHQSSVFSFKTLILLMNFDEIWWKPCFHQILSKFNFYFQSLDFFDEPVKKQINW